MHPVGLDEGHRRRDAAEQHLVDAPGVLGGSRATLVGEGRTRR